MFDALKSLDSPVARMIESEQHHQSQVMATGPLTSNGTPDDPLAAITVERRSAGLAEPPGVPPARRMVNLTAGPSKRILPFDGVDRLTAERYRILRTNVLRSAAPHCVIGVTSANPGDGKTTTSVNLAGVLALKNDLRVLLVDADLRRRGVAPMLGIEQTAGLAEVLTGQCNLDSAIVETANLPNLSILPAGGPTPSPAELLDSPAWAHLIATLRAEFSFVIIDTTPIGVVADYALVEKVCEHTILVVRPDHTARRGCAEALDKLQQDKFLGVVLNGIEEWFLGNPPDRYDYY
jgi:capsular exopolysaccharide synthesis family protein